MTHKWPSFETKDIPDDDDAEMQRRWEVYKREMDVIIAAGGVHQDKDGWWIDNATGELFGPDPEIERPLTDKELVKFRPLKEALPELYESLQRSSGRPASDASKQDTPKQDDR